MLFQCVWTQHWLMQGSNACQKHRTHRAVNMAQTRAANDIWINESGCVCAVSKTAQTTCQALAFSLWAWQRMYQSARAANTHSSSPRHILSIMHEASAHSGHADGQWNPAAWCRDDEGNRLCAGPPPTGPYCMRRVFTSARNELSQRAAISSSLLVSQGKERFNQE